MRYYLIAGEASGDLHGSNLVRELKLQDPDAQFRFFGGDLMAAQAGVPPVLHYREMAFMGFIKVMMNLRAISRNMEKCKADIVDFKPDVIILIDFAGFNLRIAEFAKSIGLKTVFYISPKIWAWKTSRIKKIKKYIDKMLTILPFETEFYAGFNYPVEYVGNPLLDAIEEFKANDHQTEADFRKSNSLTDKPIIGLLAGSRKQELDLMLPVMIEVSRQFPEYQFVISGAPGLDRSYYTKVAGADCNLPIIFGQTYDLLKFSRAALVTSGTATLETALFGVPEAVLYRIMAPNFLYRIGRKILKAKWISLANLIMGREIIRELVQMDCNPKTVAAELRKILDDERYDAEFQRNYAELMQRMGSAGASQRAAKAVIDFLTE
ncbi:MAG: lipid-A-disaccharide synthase [Salinivirgaceae bacterium]|nr:lipid-A-disaccharide synthase [Salinivirgaceae bacterium]